MTRACGDCQLCCKLLPVRSLHKGAGVRCEHQRVGKGCTVYADLWGIAPECKLWNCRWLGNDDMDELRRPDRSHYVVDVMPDFVTAVDQGRRVKMEVAQIWCDPNFPDAHRDPALRAWLERKNLIGLVRYNNERAVTIVPPQFVDNHQWLERHSDLTHEPAHTFAQVLEALGGGQ